MKVKINFCDYSYGHIDCDQGILMELREHYSFEKEGARFDKRVRFGSWDGRVRLIKPTGEVPYGLVNNIKKYCKRNDLEIEVADKFTPEKFYNSREEFDKWIDSLEIYDGDNRITPHWYQKDAVFYAIQNNRGILNLPTSAGKSLIAALISYWFITNFEGKALVIVPNTSLVTQMIGDFHNYRIIKRGWAHGIMSGKSKYSESPIFVSTWQSASKMGEDWFNQFGVLIVDECHNLGTEVQAIINNLRNCPFKFGMSGSLKDGKSHLMSYVSLFGDVFKPVSTKELMEEGKVTNLKINSIFLRYPKEDCVIAKGLDYQNEVKLIENHTRRNAWVCKLAIKLARDKQENVLILFRHEEHGKKLYNAMKKVYDKVYFANGGTSVKDRDALKFAAENGDGLIIVASLGIFSTGISIKKLHHVIFGCGLKSKVLTLQSIGRVLRKHDSKSIATLWDLVDNLCIEARGSKPGAVKYSKKNHAYKHGLQRIERYNEEKFEYSVKNIEL